MQYFLIRIHRFNRETFPRKLEEVLLNKKITKLGRGVAGDLGKLKHFGITGCAGQQEIGTLCKDKDLVRNGQSSLTNLCGEVLGLYLPKVPQIRCGNWEAPSLSEGQKLYAALDAWVSLEMYSKCRDLLIVNAMISPVFTIPSRILRDVFHVLDLIKVKLSHGTAKDFIRRLRDTFLVFDPVDKENVEAYLNSIGSDWKSHFLTNPDFVLKRVKRHIPPPEKLLPTVKFLFDKYGPLKCSNTNLPLFDQEARRTAEEILTSIELGYISDLKDGPPLYTEKGFDKNGLMT